MILFLGMRFFWCQSLVLGCQNQMFFLDSVVFAWDQSYFFGKKWFLTFSEVKGVSSIVQFVLDIWKVESGEGGQRTNNRSSTMQKQIAQTTKNTKQQQHRKKAPKGSAKAAKEAARAAQTRKANIKQQQTVAKTAPRSNKSSANILEGQKRQGVFFPQQQEQGGPNAGEGEGEQTQNN